jgi:hypothetical protein
MNVGVPALKLENERVAQLKDQYTAPSETLLQVELKTQLKL